MHFSYVPLSLFFALISTLHVNGLQCFIEGKCDGKEVSIVIMDTINKCIDHCQDDIKCRFSTFNSSNQFCYIFHDEICSDIKKEDCPMCLTSERNCNVSLSI